MMPIKRPRKSSNLIRVKQAAKRLIMVVKPSIDELRQQVQERCK